MKSKIRESNVELLRIVLMLLIIAGHITEYSGKLGDWGTPEYYITNITRCVSVFSVNTFIIISGYFGIRLNVIKLSKIEARVLFYTWIPFVAAILSGIRNIDIIKDIQLIFPLLTKKYWFITIYFVLCILSPFINRFIKILSKRQLQVLLIAGFVIFYAIATFSFAINAPQIVMDAGYGIVNFIYLYILGYYLKNYFEDNHSFLFYLVLFFLTALLLFAANYGMTVILGFNFDAFICYNTVFVLAGAVFLFLAFKNLNIGEVKIINTISKKALIVYILHMNPSLSSWMFKDLLCVDKTDGIGLIIMIIVLPFVIYGISFVIDLVVDIILKPIDKVLENRENRISFFGIEEMGN